MCYYVNANLASLTVSAGSGYMQWYQKFEYAVGHWLQKATEHVLGCVLCSPGCFSLFRGWAVMDDNVMRTYTTLPSLPQVNNIHPTFQHNFGWKLPD